jgi:hypothetical protein
VYFFHEDPDQPRQSPALCSAYGRSERRLSGCLITCGLCVHVYPLFGEKEAIFEDVLCALRLKIWQIALRSISALAGWTGEEIKNLSLRLLHHKREKPFIPACGVWKLRERCKSAGEVRRRRGFWTTLLQDLGDDGLRLVWGQIILTAKLRFPTKRSHCFASHRLPTRQARGRSSLLALHPYSRVLSCHSQQGHPSRS